MRWTFVLAELLWALTAGLTHASHYSRGESSEDTNTEFNVASTFKGGISSNRHHARAQLNAQLYPDLRQQSEGSVDIDAPSAHETGGSGVRASPYGAAVAGPQHQPAGYSNYRSGQPQPFAAPQTPPVACGGPGPGAYPECQPYSPGYPPNPNSLPGVHSGRNPPGLYPNLGALQPAAYQPTQPGYPYYPGQYLPQYPSYPPTVPFPLYPNYGPGAPGLPGNFPQVTHPGAPPTSYQNQHNYAPHATPGQRNHWDHSFKTKTEYTEDGVHKGPFDVLNNHGPQGYGSGFGGGYNGAFNRPLRR